LHTIKYIWHACNVNLKKNVRKFYFTPAPTSVFDIKLTGYNFSHWMDVKSYFTIYRDIQRGNIAKNLTRNGLTSLAGMDNISVFSIFEMVVSKYQIHRVQFFSRYMDVKKCYFTIFTGIKWEKIAKNLTRNGLTSLPGTDNISVFQHVLVRLLALIFISLNSIEWSAKRCPPGLNHRQ